MHYHIDKTAAQSAYLQLYHQLRRDIVGGVYPLGTKMPSKRLIATETGVSVITVKNAYEQLESDGFIEGRAGSGFYVLSQSQNKIEEMRAESLAEFVAAARKCLLVGVSKSEIIAAVEKITK